MYDEPEKNWPFPPPSDEEAREYRAKMAAANGEVVFKNETPMESGLDATEERPWD